MNCSRDQFSDRHWILCGISDRVLMCSSCYSHSSSPSACSRQAGARCRLPSANVFPLVPSGDGLTLLCLMLLKCFWCCFHPWTLLALSSGPFVSLPIIWKISSTERDTHTHTYTCKVGKVNGAIIIDRHPWTVAAQEPWVKYHAFQLLASCCSQDGTNWDQDIIKTRKYWEWDHGDMYPRF